MQLTLPRLPALHLPGFALPDLSGRRTLLALGAFVAVGFSAGLASGAVSDMPTCPLDQAILSYPRYNRKGLIEKYVYRCGAPDRTCRVREYTAQGPVHVCSPFSLANYAE